MYMLEFNQYLFNICPKYFKKMNNNIDSLSYINKLYILPKYLINITYFFKKHTYSQFDCLNDIIVYDILSQAIRFKVIYSFKSIIFNNFFELILIIKNINKRYLLISLSNIYYSSS